MIRCSHVVFVLVLVIIQEPALARRGGGGHSGGGHSHGGHSHGGHHHHHGGGHHHHHHHHHHSFGSHSFGSSSSSFGSSPYGGYSGYGSGYGYGGGGGGGLLSVLGGLLGFRQPYYSSPSYYYSNYQTSPYASYYQPSSYSYYQPTYYQRAAYTCDVQQYMSMSGTRQLWYCVCSGTTSYQYDGCNHPYYG